MRRPNYEDVRWDHGAADAAMGACERCAAELDRTLGDTGHAAAQARAQWQGNHQDRFAQERQALNGHGRALVIACRAAARAIATASQQAYEEQARRLRERAAYEQWQREEREREAREEEERRERARQQRV
ncbi:MAG: hypothetical protein EI684_14800 [Candidatus Viridilinea halotolerans]|uniref:Uncharacterized protein n=1 Tax=Candidatus Viridilinea halotolerans TaxID=2491704 RepID=A0A426TW57_9CHLR|nr:MAG: hypothetical protein EI684_14800 [Candidatus Viridilinea halotolerans]